MPNDIGAFTDYYDWPYSWSQDFSQAVQTWREMFHETFFSKETWTYENHVTFHHDPADPRWPWVLDVYQGGGPWDRGQLPPDQGDEIADWLAASWGEQLHLFVWSSFVWTPGGLWQPWDGRQGEFVDHIHVEFDSVALALWAGIE